jgi:phosphoglycolate phosphatase
MKKAIIFDLDGTLLDTISDLGNSMNRVLMGLGFPVHGPADYKIFVGEGMRNLVVRALPEEDRREETIRKCVSAFQEEYGRSWKKETRPYEGVPQLLTRVEEMGLATAILSNKPHDFTQVIVREFFPSHPFICVFGARDGVPHKPDPRGALDIMQQIGVLTGDICLLGDTRTDMETARNAGILPIGALWGFRSAEELRSSGAAVLIAKPEELLAHIG